MDHSTLGNLTAYAECLTKGRLSKRQLRVPEIDSSVYDTSSSDYVPSVESAPQNAILWDFSFE
jgi:hypothetical protein